MELCCRDGAGSIIFLFALSDVTHIGDRGDYKMVRDETELRRPMLTLKDFWMDDRFRLKFR